MKLSSIAKLLVNLGIVFLSKHVPHVYSHGMICDPRQRAAYKSEKCGNLPVYMNRPVDFCAHCLSGGTVTTVTKNLPPSGWHMYDPINDFDRSATRAGLCGDPLGRPDHMIGGSLMPTSYNHLPIVQVYKEGSTVDFTAEIDTNHNGYFEFFLCNLDECGTSDISGKCFKNGHCHRLIRVPHKDCEDKKQNTIYECGPIDERYPGRWYLPCRIDGPHFVGGQSGKMRYKLPEGVNCKHCVIQWYWATANSCDPRGVQQFLKRKNYPFGKSCETDGGGFGTFREDMTECHRRQVPEEFWSCADVQITRDGRDGGTVKAADLLKTLGQVESNMGGRSPNEKDKDKMLTEAEKELQNHKKPKKWQENQDIKRANRGECLLVGKPCNGALLCCSDDAMCVHTLREGFTCKYWYSLYQEAEYRANLRNEKSY